MQHATTMKTVHPLKDQTFQTNQLHSSQWNLYIQLVGYVLTALSTQAA